MKKRMGRLLCGLMVMVSALPLVAQEVTGQTVRPRTTTPWGISSSASSFRNHDEWFPKMTEAGVSTIRLFPEWRGFEPQKGSPVNVLFCCCHRQRILAVATCFPFPE